TPAHKPIALHDALPIFIAKRKMEQFGGKQIKVVAFFDDNPKKYKNYVDGVTIYSGKKDLEDIVTKFEIQELIISPQHISKTRKQDRKSTRLNSSHVKIS